VQTEQNASFGDDKPNDVIWFVKIDRRTFGEDTAYAPFEFCG
jgi:hypothetical protein